MRGLDLQIWAGAPSDRAVGEVLDLYRRVPARRGRTAEDVRLMLAETDLSAGLRDRAAGRLVAFARVLTDYVSAALVLELSVDPSRAGEGLEQTLAETVARHPLLAAGGGVALYTLPDLVAWKEAGALPGE